MKTYHLYTVASVFSEFSGHTTQEEKATREWRYLAKTNMKSIT